jgi:hypothetical protein
MWIGKGGIALRVTLSIVNVMPPWRRRLVVGVDGVVKVYIPWTGSESWTRYHN